MLTVLGIILAVVIGIVAIVWFLTRPSLDQPYEVVTADNSFRSFYIPKAEALTVHEALRHWMIPKPRSQHPEEDMLFVCDFQVTPMGWGWNVIVRYKSVTGGHAID